MHHSAPGSSKDAPARPVDSRRVLLAEDNRVNQKVALGMLRKLGFTGVAADNGRDALTLLAADSFDLIFMDLQMPELGGLETTRLIRAGEAGEHNRNIPIIAMTGHSTRRDRQACLDAGMNGYITKPISSERIREAVDELSRPTTTADDCSLPYRLDKLIGQMDGDVELAVEILEIFRLDTVERLQRMTHALRNYDFAAVGQEAQAIEGGALDVCAATLVDQARELQRAAGHKEQEYAASLLEEMAVALVEMLAVT